MLDEILAKSENLEIPLQKARILYTSAQADEETLDMQKRENIEYIISKAEDVLKEDESHLGAKGIKVRMLKALKRYDEMLELLYDMKKDPAHSNWVENQIGYQYNKTRSKDPQRVIDIFKESYNMDPSELQPWYIGKAYFAMGHYEDALKMFDLETEHEPSDYDGYTSKAEVYMMLGDYENALNQIDKAIELVKEDANRDYSSIYRIKYRILSRAVRIQEAVNFITETEKYTNFKERLTYRMFAYDRAKKHQIALACAEEIYKNTDGKDADAAYVLFLNALFEKDIRQAKKICDAAKNVIDKGEVDYWLSIIDEFELNYENIIRYRLNLLKDLNGEDDDCSIQYGVIAENYFYMGKLEEARYYAKKVIAECDRYLSEYNQCKPLYLTRKSKASMILGKEEEARELFSQARALPLCDFCDHHFCKDALSFEIFIEEAKGNYEKAIELCQKGIDENTGETDFLSAMIRIRKKMLGK